MKKDLHPFDNQVAGFSLGGLCSLYRIWQSVRNTEENMNSCDSGHWSHRKTQDWHRNADSEPESSAWKPGRKPAIHHVPACW